MNALARRILRFFHNVVFPKQLAFGIMVLNYIGDKNYCKALKIKLQEYPSGTVGHELLQFLAKNDFDFVPYYEHHDMKHVLLGYDTSAKGEICMQVFMFGNAGVSLISLSLFLSFAIWTPDIWHELPYHFLLGRFCKPLSKIHVEEAAGRNLLELRKEICLEEAKWKADMLWQGLYAAPATR